MKLYFPLCLCVVDMKGARQLCSMYDTSSNIARPCVSCNCSLDGTNLSMCTPVQENVMKSIICSDTVEHEDLQKISQHRNKYNAFFNINMGGWKYGIWGLCPSEILHQFYEGVLEYALEEFLKETLTEKYRTGLSAGVAKVINACKNLGNKNDYPHGTFSMGITKFAKMKGTEKFGCVFYLALFLHTDLAKTEYFEGKSKLQKNSPMSVALKQWLRLFELCLYYHDWMMKRSYKRCTLQQIDNKIRTLHGMFRKLVKRKGLGIDHIPKFHEFFHVTRNILWHGPSMAYDTRPSESNLRVHKGVAQNTQRHISTFSYQTGLRLFEHFVIVLTLNFVKQITGKLFHRFKYKRMRRHEKDALHGIQAPFVSRRNMFFMQHRHLHKDITFYKDASYENEIQNKTDFDDHLKYFLKRKIIDLIEDADTKDQYIICFGSGVRNGIPFRGYSPSTRVEPGWAMFQWIDSDEPYLCPGKILMYLNLKDVKFKEEYRNLYSAPGLYTVIHSLEQTPSERLGRDGHIPICCETYLENNTALLYRIVSESTIFSSCFVYPNFGSDHVRTSVLYVFPRKYNTSLNTNDTDNSWACKFA